MNVPPVVAAEDPGWLGLDLEEDEWEDLEVEEIDPALANVELGEQVVDYLPDPVGVPEDMESFLRRIGFKVGTLVMTISSTLAICREEPDSSCLEEFQAPARPFYHKLRTHWISVLGLLLAAIRLVGSLSRSKRLIAMYKAVSPFALLPIVYTMVRFVADALSKVGSLLALTLVSAVKLYDAEDDANQAAEEEDDENEHWMDRRRG
ncbi:hypothetical protein MRX96_044903 [Rhipicephalus microplus]